jgi:hypothetical protein
LRQRGIPLYTDVVNWRWAALLVCMVGAAQAESNVYRYYVPHSGALSKVEWSGPGAGWDVSVGYDAVRCEVFCAYRRTRDSFGPTALSHFLLPPATTIRLYGDSGAKPETVIVDPAGLRFPHLHGREAVRFEWLGIPSRSAAAIPVLADSDREPSRVASDYVLLPMAPRSLAAGAPLRI